MQQCSVNERIAMNQGEEGIWTFIFTETKQRNLLKTTGNIGKERENWLFLSKDNLLAFKANFQLGICH